MWVVYKHQPLYTRDLSVRGFWYGGAGPHRRRYRAPRNDCTPFPITAPHTIFTIHCPVEKVFKLHFYRAPSKCHAKFWVEGDIRAAKRGSSRSRAMAEHPGETPAARGPWGAARPVRRRRTHRAPAAEPRPLQGAGDSRAVCARLSSPSLSPCGRLSDVRGLGPPAGAFAQNADVRGCTEPSTGARQ